MNFIEAGGKAPVAGPCTAKMVAVKGRAYAARGYSYSRTVDKPQLALLVNCPLYRTLK